MSASRSKNPGYAHGKVNGMMLYKLHVTHLIGIRYRLHVYCYCHSAAQWRLVQKAL